MSQAPPQDGPGPYDGGGLQGRDKDYSTSKADKIKEAKADKIKELEKKIKRKEKKIEDLRKKGQPGPPEGWLGWLVWLVGFIPKKEPAHFDPTPALEQQKDSEDMAEYLEDIEKHKKEIEDLGGTPTTPRRKGKPGKKKKVDLAPPWMGPPTPSLLDHIVPGRPSLPEMDPFQAKLEPSDPEPPAAAAAPQQPIQVSVNTGGGNSGLASLAIMAILIIGIVVSSAVIDAEAVEGILSDSVGADLDGDGDDDTITHNPEMKPRKITDVSGGMRDSYETGDKPVDKGKLSDKFPDETVILQSEEEIRPNGWDFDDLGGEREEPAGDPPETITIDKDHSLEYIGDVDEDGEDEVVITCHGGKSCHDRPIWVDLDGDGDNDVGVVFGDFNIAFNEENSEISTEQQRPIEGDFNNDGVVEEVVQDETMEPGTISYEDKDSDGKTDKVSTGDRVAGSANSDGDSNDDEYIVETENPVGGSGFVIDDLDHDGDWDWLTLGKGYKLLFVVEDPNNPGKDDIFVSCAHKGEWDLNNDGDNDIFLVDKKDFSADSHHGVNINVLDASDNEPLDSDSIRVEVRDENGRLIGDEKLSSLPAGDYTVEVSVKMLNHEVGMATQEFTVDEGQEAQVTISVSTMILPPDAITPAVNIIAGGILGLLGYGLVRNATASRGFVRSFTMGAAAGAATFAGSYWGLAMGLG